MADDSWSAAFRENCPYYLSLGMSYEEYWRGDAEAVRYFRKAETIRAKRRNFEMWLQGLYIYEAIGDMTPVLHAFAKKGAKALPYPERPYPLTEDERAEKKRYDEDAGARMIKDKLKAWAGRVNRRKNTEEREAAEDGGGTDRTDRH